MKKYLITLLLLFAFTLQHAQECTGNKSSGQKMNITIHCNSCDINYFAENFSLVNFVTDPRLADVHIQISEMSIGNGGTTFNLLFAGHKRFLAFHDTVSFFLPAETSIDEKRESQLEKIKLGLIPCLMKTSNADKLILLVTEEAGGKEITIDPWNKWMFGLNGMGSLYNQKSYSNYNLNLNLNMSKITEEFKIESYSQVDYNETRITYYDYDSIKFQLNTFHRGFTYNNLIVKSLGKHFGIGGMLLLRNDHPNNYNLRLQAGPAFEYNVYPYSKALQKQFRFLYSTLYEKASYIDTTIFNKMDDQGWRQNLRIMARFYESWGYLDAAVSGSNYLQDLSRFSLGVNMMADIRIYGGLSINFFCGLNMYRDRINQAKGFAALNEILTRQREMATDYQYNLSIGVTYRFGSKFYPSINPRFSY